MYINQNFTIVTRGQQLHVQAKIKFFAFSVLKEINVKTLDDQENDHPAFPDHPTLRNFRRNEHPITESYPYILIYIYKPWIQ